MNISLQTNSLPRNPSTGTDPKSSDLTSSKMVNPAGVTLKSASMLVAEGINDSDVGYDKVLQNPLLPKSGNGQFVGDLLGKLTPEIVAIDIYSVLAVFQQWAQQTRNQSREVRNSELQNQVSCSMAAAKEIAAAGKERLRSSQWQGFGQILGGVATAGAASASLWNCNEAYNSFDPANLVQSQALREKYTNMSSIWKARGEAFNSFATGLTKFSSGDHENSAVGNDARSAELNAQSRVHDQSVQQANEWLQHMMDVIRDVREKLTTVDQARAETNRSIARNI